MSNPTRTRARTLLVSVFFRSVQALAALTFVYCGLALTPTGASAGRYHVYSCRMPDGQVAPTDGWTSSTNPASATVIATDTCATSGALVAALGDGVKHQVNASATWSLVLPSGEAITSATLWRAGEAEGGANANATYYFWLLRETSGSGSPEPFSECVYISKCTGEIGEKAQPLAFANVVSVPLASGGGTSSRLSAAAACGGPSESYLCPEGERDPGAFAAVVNLYAADVTLEQTAQPKLEPGTLAGELATSPKISGTASVTFEASDPGSGIYQALVEVDEKPVGATMLDSNGGRCADVGQTTDGLPAFLYLQPCARVVSADVPVDTTSLSNGDHHIVVSVTDAAGNRTVVLDRKVEVANALPSATSPTSAVIQSPAGTVGASGLAAAGSPNGSPSTSQAVLSAHWRSSAKAAIVGRWGRSQAIVGKLTSAGGVPIAGAALEVAATPSAQGARASAVATARTAADGTFSVRLSPHSSSERIVVAYRAHTGDAVPAAASTLVLKVPASIALRVAPRTSHLGGRIAFSGLLRGGHIPSSGKQIVLQARAPGAGWRTFQVLSTDRHGRYRSSYRFRLPGPVTYRFRVLSRQEADFPFSSGSSNVVAVVER